MELSVKRGEITVFSILKLHTESAELALDLSDISQIKIQVDKSGTLSGLLVVVALDVSVFLLVNYWIDSLFEEDESNQ